MPHRSRRPTSGCDASSEVRGTPAADSSGAQDAEALANDDTEQIQTFMAAQWGGSASGSSNASAVSSAAHKAADDMHSQANNMAAAGQQRLEEQRSAQTATADRFQSLQNSRLDLTMLKCEALQRMRGTGSARAGGSDSVRSSLTSSASRLSVGIPAVRASSVLASQSISAAVNPWPSAADAPTAADDVIPSPATPTAAAGNSQRRDFTTSSSRAQAAIPPPPANGDIESASHPAGGSNSNAPHRNGGTGAKPDSDGDSSDVASDHEGSDISDGERYFRSIGLANSQNLPTMPRPGGGGSDSDWDDASTGSEDVDEEAVRVRGMFSSALPPAPF